ncbi:hypothetical protein GEV33_001690 [Tenebrio molitor]|uniref:SWIM-type domain-containing protein n=1 Tax=Tenebrio molitor TaxID=7067 RepID=A0A8J6HSQ9_TENMO|nr:hypothetical protein GEV33_001690 [Tenebrio molitor]
MSDIFKVGKKFHSYSEVENSLKAYEEQTFAKFWKRDARLIASSRIPRPIRGALKYVEVKFCCIYGGQKFRPSGSGQKDIRTFKKEQLCPAHVALRVTADGRDLEVRSVSEAHNHDRSMLQFQYLPHQRRLSGKDKESVEELLALRANKKLVKQKLEQETGKVLTLKDLSNIGQKSGKKSENLDKCVDVLRNRYNAEVNILKDGENNFKGMFIQTSNMKNTFKAYPEFLGIDAEDGNCQAEIICFCLLTTEDKDSFTWFLETFRANNPQTELTKYVMADKDLLESREITCEKMGISQADRNKSLENFQKMVYAKTEGEFEQLHNLLNISAPKRVIEYFDKNWYPIKDEWSMSKNLMKGSDEQNFLDFLTNEAGRMVIKQIEFSKKMKVPSKEDNASCFVINSTEGQLRCDPTDCSCNFKAGMLLPCRHIFAIRTHLKLPLFSEELVNKRWTLDYYKTYQRRLAHDYCNNKVEIEPVLGTNLEASATPNVTVINKKKAQTYGQKRRKALITTDSLANLVAMSSNDSFDQKIDNLKTLEMLWKQGKRTRIIMINEDEAELSSSNVNENSLDVENMPIVQIEVITNVSANSENTLENASSTETAFNEGTKIQDKTDSEC